MNSIDFYSQLYECLINKFKTEKEFSAEKISASDSSKIICVDKTFLKMHKCAGGVPLGYVTANMQTILIVFCRNWCRNTQRNWESSYLIIPDRTKATFKKIITENIIEGTTVWTDSHKNYDSMPAAGYAHLKLNHSKGKFNGSEGQSSNAIEGTLSLLKKQFKLQQISKPANNY